MFEKEFKVSKSKLFDFKIEFENVINQVQKMNDGGGVIIYLLSSFCNPIVLLKRSCDLNACPLCGLWYVYNNVLTTKCGHIFHPSYITIHTTSSFKCAFICYELFFT